MRNGIGEERRGE
jgi:hypothetical protein